MKRDVTKSLDSGNTAPSSDTVVEGIQVLFSPCWESYPGPKGQVHVCGYRLHGDGI